MSSGRSRHTRNRQREDKRHDRRPQRVEPKSPISSATVSAVGRVPDNDPAPKPPTSASMSQPGAGMRRMTATYFPHHDRFPIVDCDPRLGGWQPAANADAQGRW
jgi:hypothetical protein